MCVLMIYISEKNALKRLILFVYLSQQTSLSCDTDAALSNMKQIGDVVREDHQSLVSHVCKQVFAI